MARFYQTADREYLEDGIYKPPTELAMQVIAAKDKSKNLFDEAAMQTSSMQPVYNDKLDYDSAVSWMNSNQNETNNITNQFLNGDEQGALKSLREYRQKVAQDIAVGEYHRMALNKQKADIHEQQTAKLSPLMKRYFDELFYGQAKGNAALNKKVVDNVEVFSDPLERLQKEILDYAKNAHATVRGGHGITKDGLSSYQYAKTYLTPEELEKYAQFYISTLPTRSPDLYNQLKQISNYVGNDLFIPDDSGNSVLNTAKDENGNFISNTYNDLLKSTDVLKIDQSTYGEAPLSGGSGSGSHLNGSGLFKLSRGNIQALNLNGDWFTNYTYSQVKQLQDSSRTTKDDKKVPLSSIWFPNKGNTTQIVIGNQPVTVSAHDYQYMFSWIKRAKEGFQRKGKAQNYIDALQENISPQLFDALQKNGIITIQSRDPHAVLLKFPNIKYIDPNKVGEFLNTVEEATIYDVLDSKSADYEIKNGGNPNGTDTEKRIWYQNYLSGQLNAIKDSYNNATGQNILDNNETASINATVLGYFDNPDDYQNPVRTITPQRIDNKTGEIISTEENIIHLPVHGGKAEEKVTRNEDIYQY